MGTWTNRIVGQGEEAPDQLLANPLNFRIHPKAQQAALTGALDTIGWVQQVVVNKQTGHIVDGHLRVSLALRDNQPTIPVLYVDLTEAEEAQALLSLDPIAAMAATDKSKMDELFRAVETDNEQVQKYLSELAEREGLDYGKNPPADDPGAQVDRAEELRQKWGVETGQLWALGEHRLICGDCTDRAVVERVMGGERAQVVFTDPPYGISREGIANDELEGDEFDRFNSGWIGEIPATDDALFICYHSTRTFPSALVGALNCGWNFERMLWFYRPDKFPAHTWKGWVMVSQAIMLFSRGNAKYVEVSPADQDTYRCTVKDLGNATGHPTEKIVEQCTNVMRHLGGDVIYEPFSGSGTTLIACEQLNRRCRAVEISPGYVAVALERWAQMTGKTPELINV